MSVARTKKRFLKLERRYAKFKSNTSTGWWSNGHERAYDKLHYSKRKRPIGYYNYRNVWMLT